MGVGVTIYKGKLGNDRFTTLTVVMFSRLCVSHMPKTHKIIYSQCAHKYIAFSYTPTKLLNITLHVFSMILYPVIGLWPSVSQPNLLPHSASCPAPQGLQLTLCVQTKLWSVGGNIFPFETSEPSLRPFIYSNLFWRKHQHYIQHSKKIWNPKYIPPPTHSHFVSTDINVFRQRHGIISLDWQAYGWMESRLGCGTTHKGDVFHSRSALHRSLSCMYSLIPSFIYSFVQYMLFNTYNGWGLELSPEDSERKKIILLSFCLHRRKQEIDKYLWWNVSY